MSKIGTSILKSVKEALAYAKGHRKGFKTHKIKIPASPCSHFQKQIKHDD